MGEETLKDKTSAVESPVLPRENSSTTVGVLEFSYGSTGLVAVVDLFFVMVKRQILLDACFVKGCMDDFLNLR